MIGDYKSGPILYWLFGARQGLLVEANLLTHMKTMNARILKYVPIPLLIAAAALFAGCKQKHPYVPPGAGSGGGIVSAEKNSFDEVTKQLDKGGSFYLYLSTEQALSSLSKNIAVFSNVFTQMPANGLGRGQVARIFEVIGGLAQDSGLEQISGFGASSIAREPGFYYSKVVMHHYEGQSDGVIWSAFGKEAHPLKELDLLPENTALAAYGDLDVPLLWNTVQKELKRLHVAEVDYTMAEFPAKFKAATGLSLDDVLGTLGGGYGVIFTLDESKQVTLPIPNSPMQIPDPGLAIFIKVNNDVLYNRVVDLSKSLPLLHQGEVSGIKTVSAGLPIPLPITLKPTLGRSGDYLILASSDTLFQEIVAVQTGKKSGYKSTAEFKKLSQGVPGEANNFSLISEKLGKSFSQAMQAALKAQPGMMGSQAKVLQDMMATNHGAIAYSVGANTPEGWLGVGNGNQSMGSAAVILPAAAVGGLLAAIAIPNFVRARTVSQENSCINNLRLIDSAKQQWALEHHKRNTDTPTGEDLTPYLGRGPAGQFPRCPQGGTYIIGSVGEKPRCSIPGHVLP